MKIKLLDASVANKIAAGEVVERPASIVKELAENSIDAGAKNITVEIKGGGIDLIRITDNGCGMAEDDVKNAFMRHATSKISVAEDLNDIATLGFRGEALASVAAVSKISLQTKTRDFSEGTEIELSGGVIEKFISCGCPDGTVIKVADLFFNTPARRKFLKRPSQEASYINDVIERLALSHPEISFRFISDGKSVLRTPGDGELISSIRALFGAETARNVIEVCFEKGSIKIDGYIGKREIQKSNRSSQYLFINGRSVKNEIVSAAVQNGFEGRLNIGKFPYFVLKMTIDGTLVDVNVHPTKQEVRFAQGLPVYDTVLTAVRGALSENQEIPTLFKREAEDTVQKSIREVEAIGTVCSVLKADTAKDGSTSKESTVTECGVIPKKQEAIPSVSEDFFNLSMPDDSKLIIKPKTIFEPRERACTEAERACDVSTNTVNESVDNGDTVNSVKADIGAAEDALRQADSAENSFTASALVLNDAIEPFEEEKPKQGEQATLIQPTEYGSELLPDYKIIGVMFDTYIIVTSGEDAYIIDQHAAHERILFERLYRQEGKKSASQLLLIPEIIKLTPQERGRLEDNLDGLREMGFEIEDMGFSSIAVKATPSALEETNCADFIASVLSESNAIRLLHTNELKRERLMQLACKSAVKAGDKLTNDEITELMRLIVKERVPLSCPHGRPILISLTRHELEVRFKRIQ